MPAVLLAAWTRLRKAPAWLWGALGVLAAIAWAYLSGRSRGAEKAAQQQQAETLERYKERDDVEEDLARLPADERRDRLKKWTLR